MLDISNTAAAMVDGDALEKITKDDYDSPEYQNVLKTLTYFQENIELDYIYCIMQVGEKEFVFGVDAAVEDPGEFGSPVVFTDALYNASKGKADADNEPYEDKTVNDDYGHDMGDKLIIGISQDITEIFDEKRVYRVGGDEFVAIVDEADPSEKTKAVKDIIARKNAESPLFHEPGVEIGLSIGYATYDSSKDRTYSELFNRADNAMYADKRAFYETHEDRRRRR